MSKKLMMNNYNEKGLTPVMDGLICWLDARDYDGTNILKDRSGNGHDFKIYGNIQYSNSFLYLNKNKNNYIQNDYSLGLDWNNTTIQMRVANIVNQDGFLFSVTKWDGFNIRYGQLGKDLLINKHGGRWFSRTSLDLTNEDVVIIGRYDVDKIFIRCDGMNDSLVYTDTYDSNIHRIVTIGGSSVAGTSYQATMKFGSILIYDRILTDEEIQQNYLYERSIDRRIQTKTTLTTGALFNSIINELKSETENTITRVVFTKSAIPNDKLESAKIVSNGDNEYVNCYAYVGEDNTTIYVSPEVEGCTIYANINCYGMFHSQKELISIEFDNLDTSFVTSMSAMFYGCDSLLELDLSNFCTTNVINMSDMLRNCLNLERLINPNFDTSKVDSIQRMFQYCNALSGEITISNPAITNYTNMFSNTSITPNSKFIVKYIDEKTKAMAEKLVATKPERSNVFLWEGEDI